MRVYSPPGRLSAYALRVTRALGTACLLVGAMGGLPDLAYTAQARSAYSGPESIKGNAALAEIERGDMLLSRGQAAEAEVLFRKALALQPDLAIAHHGLGLALWDQGKRDEALKELTVASQLAPSDEALHLDLAKAAWALADEYQASSSPGNLDVQIRAETYRSLAIQHFKEALQLKPGDATLRVDLARLLLEDRKPRQAIAEVNDVLKVDPSNADALETMARAYLAENNSVEALAELNKAVQQNPRNGALYVALGQFRQSQGNIQQAISAFQRAIELSPGYGPAYSALGELLLRQNQVEQAREIFERAVALNPDNWEDVFRLGDIDDKAGYRKQATDLYHKALSLHPDFPDARQGLAVELLREDHTASAATQALLIAANHPQAPQYYRIMALVQWKDRNYDLSLKECELALAAQSHSARILSIKALDLWQEGQKREATRAFVEAARFQQNIASPQVFCRLILCGPRDVGIVETFLRKNRGALMQMPENPGF
jgi:tetratricopeptide (TPR) repeat protein